MRRVTHVIVVLAITLCVGQANADDTATSEKQRATDAYDLINRRIKEFSISFDDGDQETLTRKPQSLLRWSNPVIGSVYGEVFVWMHDGRPHAIISAFRFYSPMQSCSFECQSLSSRKMKAEFRDGVAWLPPAEGIEWKTLPKAKPPSRRKSLRLLQMRSLAKSFSAVTYDRKDESIERRMNLQATPLLRYGDGQNIVDGAIFGLALGTDPEIALLVEAVKSDSEVEWRYAFARQNSVAMKASHKGQVVWDQPKLAPPWPQVRVPTETYMLFNVPIADANALNETSNSN